MCCYELQWVGSTHSRRMERTLGVNDPQTTHQGLIADVLALLGLRPLRPTYCHTFALSNRLLKNAYQLLLFAGANGTPGSMVGGNEFPSSVKIGKHVYWSEKKFLNWLKLNFSAQEAWRP